MAIEDRHCPRCGNLDTLVPLPDEENDERTTTLGDQVYAVKQFRCATCALSDLVEREAGRAARALPDPAPGEPAIGDGRVFVATPVDPPLLPNES